MAAKVARLISSRRPRTVQGDAVRFRYKDYTHGDRRKVMQLDAVEFLRRFALHVLPRGFNRIRHYGRLANRNKCSLLAQARTALAACNPPACPAESVRAFWQRVAGIDIERCPRCRISILRLFAALSPATRPPP